MSSCKCEKCKGVVTLFQVLVDSLNINSIRNYTLAGFDAKSELAYEIRSLATNTYYTRFYPPPDFSRKNGLP